MQIMYMKKLFLLILCVVHCALCIDLRAQDDAESIVSGDIEVEGLDNFWVESRLITDIDKITPSASLVPLKQGDNKIVDVQFSFLIPHSSFLIIQGLPADDLRLAEHRDGVDYIPRLPTELLQWYMQEAKQIVCRSGYSSIMDLHTIGRKAHLIPTPGQTEQEYLVDIYANICV